MCVSTYCIVTSSDLNERLDVYFLVVLTMYFGHIFGVRNAEWDIELFAWNELWKANDSESEPNITIFKSSDRDRLCSCLQ